jgi:rubrerythrin
MHLQEVLAWAEEKSPEEILELAMAIETNAFDHYIALQRNTDDANVVRLYELLVDEERRHLKKLSSALESLLHLH